MGIECNNRQATGCAESEVICRTNRQYQHKVACLMHLRIAQLKRILLHCQNAERLVDGDCDEGDDATAYRGGDLRFGRHLSLQAAQNGSPTGSHARRDAGLRLIRDAIN